MGQIRDILVAKCGHAVTCGWLMRMLMKSSGLLVRSQMFLFSMQLTCEMSVCREVVQLGSSRMILVMRSIVVTFRHTPVCARHLPKPQAGIG